MKINIQGHKFRVKCFVVDMLCEHTLILGERFLLEHKAVLDYGQGTCTLQKEGRKVVLQSQLPKIGYKRNNNIVLNATQFKKAARKASTVYLLIIN